MEKGESPILITDGEKEDSDRSSKEKNREDNKKNNEKSYIEKEKTD